MSPRKSSVISDELREKLQDVGGCLQGAFVNTEGTYLILPRIDPRYLHELGTLIERIAQGENARDLLGQSGRTKPKNDDDRLLVALAYWSVRARRPSAPDGAALASARGLKPQFRKLTDATVRKYSQLNRVDAFKWMGLDGGGQVIRHRNTRWSRGKTRSAVAFEIQLPTLQEREALGRYLRKKSARAHVEV